MKTKIFSLVISTILLFVAGKVVIAQDDKNNEAKGYSFEIIKEIPVTSIKDQYRSSTCWSFSSLSFLESELLRMGKGTYDLSEMFVVRQAYIDKAIQYVRYHGTCNFGSGGAFHDAFYVKEHYGLVPQEVFPGTFPGEDLPVHGEMDEVAKAYLDAVIKNPNKSLSPAWLKGFEGIMDAYLGDYPAEFTYNGKKYSPRTFADDLGINADDYVELGSFSHHPFYSKFIIEIPDNWTMDKINNLPLDEMIQVIDFSIENGYCVAWGCDISEKGFSWKNGVAIVPEDKLNDLSGTEKEKWEKLTSKEKANALYNFDGPVKEKKITQELRQEEFDNYQTTDDHGLMITGIARDQEGNKYYKVKNSWGNDHHIYDGYFFASEAYVKLKTIDIMVRKDGIPNSINKKLGL